MAEFGRGGKQPDRISGVVPRGQYERALLEAQELDQRRQEQIERQRTLLNMNAEKFIRLLWILDRIDATGQMDLYPDLRKTIKADAEEVKSWRSE